MPAYSMIIARISEQRRETIATTLRDALQIIRNKRAVVGQIDGAVVIRIERSN